VRAASVYPAAPVVRRERAHRRRVVLGIGVLLVLAAAPFLGHHLPLGLDGYLAGRDHLWALCMVALQALLAPVHGLLHLLVAAGLSYAVADRVRAHRRQRRALAALHAVPPSLGDTFWRAAAAAGIDPRGVRVVRALANPAFTTGWLRPRIYVARDLAGHLTAAELTAVLAHEGAHAARRDPLRLSLLRFLSCTLFWLPALHGLAADAADEAEIRADDRAAPLHPLALASAILKLAQWGTRPAAGSAGFGPHGDLMDRRVRRLAGEHVTPRSRVSRRSLAATAAMLFAALVTGGVAAHPHAGAGTTGEAHCEHHGAAVFYHLFCLGFAAPSSRDSCPHRLHG
jgi:Zn-dependent protease with chaperone function